MIRGALYEFEVKFLIIRSHLINVKLYAVIILYRMSGFFVTLITSFKSKNKPSLQHKLYSKNALL